jgi:hypothetical protein
VEFIFKARKNVFNTKVYSSLAVCTANKFADRQANISVSSYTFSSLSTLKAIPPKLFSFTPVSPALASSSKEANL